MSRPEEQRDAEELSRLLAGAARTIAKAPFCWLMTGAESAGVDSRPMGRLPRDPDDDPWKFRFITDGRSRKASEIRRDAKVGIIVQHDTDDAFAALNGRATVHDGAVEIRQRWKAAYDAYFPSEEDRANAIFVEVDIERMELWIRGVTPEPFGLQATILERSPGGEWRLIAADPDGA